jgi:serine/threonine protein kinase
MNEDQLRMIFEHIPADKVKPVDDSLLESLSRKAKRSVLRTFTASSNFSSSVETMKALPKFNRDEVRIGKLLGTGQFGEVSEIKRFNLKDCLGSSCNSFTRETDSIEADGREFLATHCLRSVQGKCSARYAIKTLQIKYHKDPACYYLGAKDLAREAHFLSSLEHPHVVKLRATAAVDLCSINYFIILDRLYGTVRDQINEWKKRQNRKAARKKFRFMSVSDKEAQLEMFEECLRIAFDISSALRYLHANNLIHRDVNLKTLGLTSVVIRRSLILD